MIFEATKTFLHKIDENFFLKSCNSEIYKTKENIPVNHALIKCYLKIYVTFANDKYCF